MAITEIPAVGPGEIPLSELLAAASRIDGVDIELALSRISWKQNVLEACIEQTAYSIGEKLKKMSICLSNGDLHDFSIEAHGLKVALAGVGAASHSALAASLERASKAGDEHGCKKGFIEFAGMAKTLAEKLKSVIPHQRSAERPQGDSKLLFQVIRESADFLNSFEADDALNCMSRLDAFTFGAETDALLEHIKNKVKAYKYDDAVLTLRSILVSSSAFGGSASGS